MAKSLRNLKRLLLLALTFQFSVSEAEPRCPEPRFQSQRLVIPGGPWPPSPGQPLTVSCPVGWRLNGTDGTITCTAAGQWSPYWPKCLMVKCPVLTVQNGMLSTQRTRFGGNVTVTCSPRYVSGGSGLAAKAITLTCQNNGSWNQPTPSCVPGCGRPPVYGKLQLREPFVLQEAYRLDASVSYGCAVGYTRAGGSSISRCKPTGWTRVILRCEPKSCGSAGEILNGRYVYNEGVEFGNSVSAVCNEGYHLIGQNTRFCTSTGWDGREAVCEPVQCPPPPQVVGAELSGSVDEPHLYSHMVIYRCPSGYLVGEREMHCTKDGTWSAPPPQCLDLRCRQPVMRFGSRTWNYKLNYKPGEKVGVACGQGTRLEGASTLTCGIDGQWDPPVPTCVWIS
ncbi:membrane cofactor protein-like isoform X1 [Alosa sapidissima]|uniref:membrane cofactor protein-like isoform X1 n=1 Tax=Alosa sapidissima TaxID=34773 RepID=UPI001C0958F0|nr:membrane cofactor protein-like isoform X1 [Alosa sapidissima]